MVGMAEYYRGGAGAGEEPQLLAFYAPGRGGLSNSPPNIVEAPCAWREE
jgi:hypothetical protein